MWLILQKIPRKGLQDMIDITPFLIKAGFSALVAGANIAMKTIKKYWESEVGTVRISVEQVAVIEGMKKFIEPDASLGMDKFVTSQCYQLCCSLLECKKDLNGFWVINGPPNLRALADYGYYENTTIYIQSPELTSEIGSMCYYFSGVQESSRTSFCVLRSIFENNIETLIYPVISLCLIKLALLLTSMRVITEETINILSETHDLLKRMYERSSAEYKSFAPLSLKYFESFFKLAKKLCEQRLKDNEIQNLLERVRGLTFMNASRAYKLAISILCSNDENINLVGITGFLIDLDVLSTRQRQRRVTDKGINWEELGHQIKRLFHKAKYNLSLSTQEEKIFGKATSVFEETYKFMRLAMFNTDGKVDGQYKLHFLNEDDIKTLKGEIVVNRKISRAAYGNFLTNRRPYIFLMLDLTIIFSQLGAILTYINGRTRKYGEVAAKAMFDVLISSQIVNITLQLLKEYSQYLKYILSIFDFIASQNTSDFRVLLNELQKSYLNLYQLLEEFNNIRQRNTNDLSQNGQHSISRIYDRCPTKYVMVVLEAAKYFVHKREEVRFLEDNVLFRLGETVQAFNSIIIISKDGDDPRGNIQKLIAANIERIKAIFELANPACPHHQLTLAKRKFKLTCEVFAQFRELVVQKKEEYFKAAEEKHFHGLVLTRIDQVAFAIHEFITRCMSVHLQQEFNYLPAWSKTCEMLKLISPVGQTVCRTNLRVTESLPVLIKLEINCWINEATNQYQRTIVELMDKNQASSWKPWRWEHHGDQGIARAAKIKQLISHEAELCKKFLILHRFFTGYYNSIIRRYRENSHSFSTIIFQTLQNSKSYILLKSFLSLDRQDFTILDLKRNLAIYAQTPARIEYQLNQINLHRQQEIAGSTICSELDIQRRFSLSIVDGTASEQSRRNSVLSSNTRFGDRKMPVYASNLANRQDTFADLCGAGYSEQG